MRVLVFAHAVRAGGGRVTCTNILRALASIDGDNTYCVIVPDQPEYRALELEARGHEVRYYRRKMGLLGRMLFDGLTLKRIVRRFRPDVVWGMGNLGLSAPPCPQAISIQHSYLVYGADEMAPLSLKARLSVFALRRALRVSLPRTSVVFCQTATMESRLRSRTGYQGKTVVTSKEISAFAAAGERSEPASLQGVKERFRLIYVTRYYPHKGLETLVETFERYGDDLSDTVAVITIAAKQHPAAARLLERIEKAGLQDRVINVGPVPQHELAGYYAACDALLMPTRLESFSGTYLEAMHFGIPILTSDMDFAREVCGDAALYFDPADAGSVRDAIVRLKNDPALQNELVERGKQRLAEEFDQTWEDIAATIKTNLEQLVAQDSAVEGVR